MDLPILLADGDARVLAGLELVVQHAGHRVLTAGEVGAALTVARKSRPEVVLIDVEFVVGADFQALRELTALDSAPSVIVLAAHAELETAVAAMRAGASDFVEKPLHRASILAALERVLRARALASERDRLRRELAEGRPSALVGNSPALRRVLDEIDRVARTPRTTVLIQGESGVGKELVARAIHERSSRRSAPFVALNCAALAESLLEAELFGYEPGAFTGAASRGRDGLIHAAEGGTLFLDEIAELAPSLQAKLLRVLQERTYRRVGGTAERALDVRVVASTHRDLAAAVDQGRFREDLFYRLNVMSIRVPRLADRRDDIAVLARTFLERISVEFGRRDAHFTPRAIEALERHAWPGNVRELRNAVERALLASDGRAIEPEHLGLLERGAAQASSRNESEFLPLGDRSLKSVEAALIRRVLVETGGNRSHAARVLGINRATLYNKLEALREES